MPLQNRVRPDGEIIAAAQRGLFMGNRGGRFHDAETRTLPNRRHWASQHWITCVLQFNDRHREQMMQPNSYTELFFMDEVTALAAGHRPCFECRRADANDFAARWKQSLGETGRMKVAEMDRILHSERCSAPAREPVRRSFDSLADGVIVRVGANLIAKHAGRALLWSLDGYSPSRTPTGDVTLVTPPSIEKHALARGFAPVWHPSAQSA